MARSGPRIEHDRAQDLRAARRGDPGRSCERQFAGDRMRRLATAAQSASGAWLAARPSRGIGPLCLAWRLVLLDATEPLRIAAPFATARRILNMTALTVVDANAARKQTSPTIAAVHTGTATLRQPNENAARGAALHGVPRLVATRQLAC